MNSQHWETKGYGGGEVLCEREDEKKRIDGEKKKKSRGWTMGNKGRALGTEDPHPPPTGKIKKGSVRR